MIIVGVSIYYSSKNTTPKISREEALIESKGIPEFNSENNTIDTVTPDEKKLAEEMMPIFKSMGDGKDSQKNKDAITALSGIIKKYPEYSDAYFLRATISILVNDTNYSSILSDIDNAIKFHSSTKYQSSSDSTAGLYSLRAKVDILANDYQQAVNDLNTAITFNPTKTGDIFNTGGVKPTDDSNPTALQKKDFDLLVSKYPDDYRVYIFRGLFYSSFSFYDTQYYQPAFDDLKKAITINSNSAFAYYFLGTVYQKVSFNVYAFKLNGGTSAYDSARDSMNTKALESFNEAIKIDPKFKEADAQIAESLYSLKRYSEAIPYYDKVIEIDPNDAGAYNDRGLSKTYTNDYYSATSDFSDAIRLKKTDQNSLENTYENRANAYVKASNYNSAIEDFNNAIGLKFASQVFLMSLPQIRTLYPEFKDISDQDLLEGLRQKYFSNMSSKDFVDNYNHDTVDKNKEKKPFTDFILGDLYTSRGDAYLLKGDYRSASKDYARAVYEGSTSVTDRWKKISSNGVMEYSIDIQTLDFSKGNLVSLWFKSTDTNLKAYTEQNYQIDCEGKKIKSLSSTTYDLSGNAGNSTGEQDWQSVVPESVGEILYNGMCSPTI